MNNRNKKKKKYCFLALVLMAFLMVCAPAMGRNGEKLAGVRTVEAASKYVTARFWDASGETSYGKLRIKVKKGNKITLPQVPAVSGYLGLGWSTTKNAARTTYTAGKTIRLRKNISLYAVRKKTGISKVYFYNSDGKSSTTFKKLNKTVTRGSYVTLPSLPEKNGYDSLGWSTSKESSTAKYKEGQKLTIKKNTRLYAVYAAKVSVTLCKNDGTIYRTDSVVSGASYTLPSVRNASGYTFMGWDVQPGKQAAPMYEAGTSIAVTGNIKLYAVVFNRDSEKELSFSDLDAASGWRMSGGTGRGYSHVIFVGDSRTVRMELTLRKQFGTDSSILRDIDFVSREGMGIEWLKTQGYQQILSLAETYYSVWRPTAVIFNLGVNDPGRAAEYISYYEEIAEILQRKNCKLFFMSVNPVNSKTIEYFGKNSIRTEAVIRRFNAAVSSGIAGNYSYIDTYSYLMQNGYGTNYGGSGTDVAYDDGLHYTTKTYKRIFEYCLNYLQNH